MTLTVSSLPAGSTLVIDRETLEVKLDGVKAYDLTNGEFPALVGGSNTIEYSDDNGSRDVDVELTYTERYQ